MTTTTKTKAWLRAIGSMRFGDLAIANLEELHGMLHDLIHIDDVDALRAALLDRDLGEAVEVERWRDIETAPTDGGEVLVYVGKSYVGGCVVAVKDANGDWLDWDGDVWEPTHWMPLPAAPDAKP
jgi:hypothetical protein